MKSDQSNRAFAEELVESVGEFGLVPLGDESTIPQAVSVRDLRRKRRRQADSEVGRITLVDDDGILRWDLGGGRTPARQRRRGRRGRASSGGTYVARLKFENLAPNQVRQKLIDLDAKLTPNQGLHEISRSSQNVLRSNASPVSAGRILLVVHGTFSNCEHIVQELQATDEGRTFLSDALRRGTPGGYDQVLAFNHATVSSTPLLNAVELSQLLRSSQAAVDVVCHSRGGLVTRWWRESLDHRGVAPGKAILVGCPLGGTGLASPARLKGGMDVLINYAKALKQAARISGMVFPVAMPIAKAVSVVMSIVGGLLKVGSKTPLLDAGIGLIPGLSAQGREGANLEVLGLREHFASLPAEQRSALARTTCVVKSNFEPEEVGWRFWRVFRRPKDRILDAAADIVFDGANDLVVDTDSMTELSDELGVAKARQCDFGTNATVHHSAYFQDAKTIRFLRDQLMP